MEFDIVDILQEKVDELCEQHFITDICIPRFTVSILYDYQENKKQQVLILTLQHLGSSFSRPIFPIEESFYGYESLYQIMRNLYNQTM